MKNFKKVFAAILVAIISSALIISCGGPKTTPEESGKIFLDVVLKDDKTNIDKIGMSEEDYNKFKQEKENQMIKGFESGIVDKSILTDEITTQFKNDILKGLSTLKYEVTPVKEEKDTATVEVKIQSFDIAKISADAQSAIINDVTNNPNITEKEIYAESFKLVGAAIAAGTVKEDTKKVTLTLTKHDNVWLPNDNDIFTLIAAIMGA